MKLIADESLPLHAFRFLLSTGYDITSVAISYRSIKDPEVLRIAIEESRVVITLDRDFGELIFKRGMYPAEGLIYLRLSSVQARSAGPIVHELITSPGFNTKGHLTVHDGIFTRQRAFDENDTTWCGSL